MYENLVNEDHSILVERTFDAGAVQLNYAEGPDNGPPLILVHGLGRRWQVFFPLIPTLSEHWHIFAPDLRGHGKSSHVARGYHGPQYFEDVVRLLRERVSAPAVLFGHSLGGMLAMRIASFCPELVRALILADNRIVILDRLNPMYIALFSGLRDLARAGGSIEEVARGIGQIVVPVRGRNVSVRVGELPGNDEAYLLAWASCVQNADPDTYAMTVDGSSLEGWDGEALLRGITCPTLLLQANSELGGLMSDSDVALAARLLPHQEHVKFHDLGHALFLQQPEPVLRTVIKFLGSL